MGRTSFVLGSSWASRMLDVPDEDFATIVKAVFQYAVNGDEVPVGGLHKALVAEMTQFIADNNEKYEEVCRKRREAGSLGGKQKVANAKQMLPNAKQMVANGSKCLHDNDNDNDNDYDNENDKGIKEDTKVSEKETRHKYGRYNNVLLSDSDMTKLQAEFPNDWQERIERLSEYIESKGAKYKNHLATIRAWARKDAEKGTNKFRSRNPFDAIDNMNWG
jgi:hypothetical protein